MFKLASWNVNSLKIRLKHVLAWLEISEVDVLALQETKLVNEVFPQEAFTKLGYHVAFSGQKTYNGVALISRHPINDIVLDVPGFIDPQRRVLAASTGPLRIINLYVPNGSDLLSDKYLYKINWLQKITAFIAEELLRFPNLVIVGDFNIAPEDRDVHSPEEWQNNVLVSPRERQAFATLLALGFHDSFRNFEQDMHAYSWWDYRAGAFRRNRGLRIDHILLSKALNPHCLLSAIDSVPRQWERPSDHAPVWAQLSL